MTIRDPEALHRLMYEAHEKLTSGAAKLHEALVMVTAGARYQEDVHKFEDVMEMLQLARKTADQAWSTASTARSDIIKLTGCNGNCSASTSILASTTGFPMGPFKAEGAPEQDPDPEKR